MKKHDLLAYLNRIGYNGSLNASYEALCELQKQHLLHVPFENLDILYDNPITLNTEQFYRKIVNNRRGGFCYELNGLFHELLENLGFQVMRVSARVFENDACSDEFDHLALVVELDSSSYLVDVGFGDFSFHPLDLYSTEIQQNKNGNFSVQMLEDDHFIIYKLMEDASTPQYRFQRSPRSLKDYASRCTYHQSDPSSHFTQQKLISIDTSDGRITLTDKKLKIRRFGKVEETSIQNSGDFEDKLKVLFGITIDEIVNMNKN